MRRRGTTLIELVVSMAILGVVAGVTALAVHSLAPPEVPAAESAIRQARADAIRSGVAVRLVVLRDDLKDPVALLFLPDGRVVGNDPTDSTGENR